MWKVLLRSERKARTSAPTQINSLVGCYEGLLLTVAHVGRLLTRTCPCVWKIDSSHNLHVENLAALRVWVIVEGGVGEDIVLMC
jgi:hypothetical protein